MTTPFNFPFVINILSGIQVSKYTHNSDYQRAYYRVNRVALLDKKTARNKEISKQGAKYYLSHKAEIAERGAINYHKNRKKVLDRAMKRRQGAATIETSEVASGTRKLTGGDKAVEERRQKCKINTQGGQ